MMSRTTSASSAGRSASMRRMRRRSQAAGRPYCSTNGCTSYLEVDPATGCATCPICGFQRPNSLTRLRSSRRRASAQGATEHRSERARMPVSEERRSQRRDGVRMRDSCDVVAFPGIVRSALRD